LTTTTGAGGGLTWGEDFSITGYDGQINFMVVPDYVFTLNGDGTTTAHAITIFNTTDVAGNTSLHQLLFRGTYLTSITGTFSGCSNLQGSIILPANIITLPTDLFNATAI